MKNFGSLVFTEEILQNRISQGAFEQWLTVKNERQSLPSGLADIIACAMRDWAIEQGATHYSHWFLPLTGSFSEKHETFLDWRDDQSAIIQAFTAKELIQSQPDASSFPSGGLRTTFEARGYTAWDIRSPAFLSGKKGRYTLTIPTVLISFAGEALDKKTPLLRSLEAINTTGVRLLKQLGFDDVKSIISNLGPEQEYFLIDEEDYKKRPDLQTCGRTIIGAESFKGQELGDHYCGILTERVKNFMFELNQELWELGVPAKTQHNEVAPQQFELAVLYGEASNAVTWNALVMARMQEIARRHKFVCLLHEKPFKNLNGSGKHINWSLVTDTDIQLFKESSDPRKQELFCLMLSCVMYTVNNYSDMLRASVASFNNDFRLGGHEAPPAILSLFLGKELCKKLEDYATAGANQTEPAQQLDLGTDLANVELDNSDRNRTSPFGFSGNKFEFRMPGSEQNPAWPTTILHAGMSEAFALLSKQLDKNPDLSIQQLTLSLFQENKRILFNGDGYTKEWYAEAQRRQLPNFANAIDAYQAYNDPKNKLLLSELKILTPQELEAHYNIDIEIYNKEALLNAQMMLNMVNRGVIPELAQQIQLWQSLKGFDEEATAQSVQMLKNILDNKSKIDNSLQSLAKMAEPLQKARHLCDTVLPLCEQLREACDHAESISDVRSWPYPSYDQMLFVSP